MGGKGKTPRIAFYFLVVVFFLPMESRSAFYKYIDRDGNLCFVDDLTKVPLEYRDQVKVYKEKYDHLPEKERAINLERDRRLEEAHRLEERRKLEEQRRREQERKLEKKRKEEEIAGKEDRKRAETNVVILGNQVLVPVTLGYRGDEVETLLVLDTGSSSVVLLQEIADRLHVKQVRTSRVQVAGGGVITTDVVKLDYIKVGPIKKTNMTAHIIEHEGPSIPHRGLLGMNFLRGLEYSIDFERQVIVWKP
jgi:clan AA aspartic protease (TIGR02281 family)